MSSESLRGILRVGGIEPRRRTLVAVVDRRNGGLVGQDVDRASEARELHRDRRDVVVADQDVLVLFLHQLVARGHEHLDHVLAIGQHRRAVGRIGDADRAVRAGH